MLSEFMITGLGRFLPRVAWLAVLSCLGLVACERTPLLAPSGSTITLISSTSTLALNSTTTLTVQVLEPAGTAPHSGTTVNFTTTLGTISPAQADTDVNGRATVTFSSGSASGVATILASSGGASVATANAVKIAIGAAAVGQITLSANPGSVPAVGGSTTVTANVVDTGGNPLGGVPVSFVSDVGTLFPAVVASDANGKAQTTLTTTSTAKITATAGSATLNGTTTTPAPTATLTVSVTLQPTLVITPPTTPPSAGLPASFTFNVTVPATGSAVRSLNVNWGDGSSTNLGGVTGTAVVSHKFATAGTYTVTGTVTDSAGNVQSVSTVVTVIPTPQPTILITPSPVPGHVNTLTTLSIQVSLPTGLGVQNLTVNFGDGTSATLGGATSASQPHVYTAVGTYTVTVTVTDTSGQSTIGTAVISIAL